MTSSEISTWLNAPIQPLKLENEILLVDFEDEVADHILPEGMDPDNTDVWLSRAALRDIVRPTNFFGTIQMIQITALDEPYERLMDARERGLRFGEASTGRGLGKRDRDGESIERTKAFDLELTTTNGISKTPGRIETEAWYMPMKPFGKVEDGFPPIRRIVAIPKLYAIGNDGSKTTVPEANTSKEAGIRQYGMPGSARRTQGRRTLDI